MSDSALRAAIKTLLDEVTAIAVVYDYQRYAADDAAFIALFEVDDVINGWEIVNCGFRVKRMGRKIKMIHYYKYKGYYHLEDTQTSENAFAAIVDAVVLKLSSKPVTGAEMHLVPEAGAIYRRAFGTTVCRCVEIDHEVAEILTPTVDEEIVDLHTVGLNYYLAPDDGVADATDIVEVEHD